MDMSWEMIAGFVVAAGALGTAAAGIVDGLKPRVDDIGLAGYGQLTGLLGEPVMACLRHAYGERHGEYLRALYRGGRGRGELPTALRQGVRLGLGAVDTARLAEGLPGVDAAALERAATAMEAGDTPDGADRPALARFELAMDARIKAALALAEQAYIGTARLIATAVSVGVAAVVGLSVATASGGFAWPPFGLALLVGLAAVPVAPIAKDLSRAITTVGRFTARQP